MLLSCLERRPTHKNVVGSMRSQATSWKQLIDFPSSRLSPSLSLSLFLSLPRSKINKHILSEYLKKKDASLLWIYMVGY